VDGQLTNAGRMALLDAMFRPDRVAPPDEVWLALTRQIPTDASSGAELGEPNTEGYSRAAYPTGKDYWTTSGYSTLVTTRNVFWPVPTGDWGVVRGWAMVSSSTSGTVLGFGDLEVERIVVGSQLYIPAGGLSIALGMTL
jgi:hypothetical protein